MTAASNSESRKRDAERLADPTPHTDPTAAAVRAAQAEAWDEGAEATGRAAPFLYASEIPANPYRLATDTAAPECICPYTPPETWTSAASCGYGSGYEPGSMQEWNPDCPAHPPAAPVAVEGVETVEALARRVEAALAFTSERGVSCGGPSIDAEGCFAGDLAARVRAALSPVEPETSEPEGGGSR